MHICFILPHIKPAGGPKVVLTLSSLLQARGHKVTVAVKNLKDIDLSWLFAEPPRFELLSISSVSRRCLPTSIDVLINYLDGEAFGPLPDVHHVLFLQGFGSQQYEKEVLNLLYPYSAVICTSKWLADLAAEGGHQKIFIVPPGIDDRFKPLNVNKPKLVTIGSLYHKAPQKNLNLFIATMNRLRKALGGNANALFLSSKYPDFEKFAEIARFHASFMIKPQPHLLPFIYSSVHVWVAPSINEGFGLTPLEAMKCGVPTVIVPSHGLDQYLVDGRNCVIAKPDKMFIVDAVIRLLENDGYRQNIIENGIGLAKQFSWEKSVESFEKALISIVKG